MFLSIFAIVVVLACIIVLFAEAINEPAIPAGMVVADYIADRKQAVLAYGRAVKACRQQWSNYVFNVGKCPTRERMAYERYNQARQRMHQIRANCYDLGVRLR